ncbi:MAG TPA: MCE family protein [Sulfurovum sp.]|nr:MCE family protein [Sulfurovum sp.]
MSENVPEIRESSKFNLFTSIWIVPFIALIIAGWLAYQHFAERGPEIKILFPQNEGLIAGQSVVKFRNVPVGKVTNIYVDKETEGVTVVVRMNTKKAKPYMTEHAKFWIVKPEVGITGVSGLDTLLSGTYINVYSKAGGKKEMDTFLGLSQPFRDTMEGEYFRLISDSAENVSIGMPVYYKNIKVGQVEYVYLSLNDRNIEIIIFIDKAYVDYVHKSSKFWSKNMVNVDFSKGNLDVHIAPLHFMLQGGIMFSSTGRKKNDDLLDNHVFPLYESKTKAESTTIGAISRNLEKFTLLTESSIANLRVKAPVRFDGFDIGRVEAISLSYSKRSHKMLGKVIVQIDTSVFKDSHEDNTTADNGLVNFYEAVEAGLRAKITALDPITGMLFVDLTFKHKEDGNQSINKNYKYAQIPMAKESSTDIMSSVGQILDTINNLPLDTLVDNLNNVILESEKPIQNADALLVDLKTTVNNINKLTSKKSFEVMPDELNKALKQMTKTLKETSKVVKGYDSNSLVKNQLAQTLEILTKTSQEMSIFLRMLNRKPNSLIFGDN